MNEEMREGMREVEERLSDVRERLRRRPDLMAVLEVIEDSIRELLEDLGSDDDGEVEVEEDL